MKRIWSEASSFMKLKSTEVFSYFTFSSVTAIFIFLRENFAWVRNKGLPSIFHLQTDKVEKPGYSILQLAGKIGKFFKFSIIL